MVFITQPSFVGGEITPSLHGRVDLDKYAIAVETMKNIFCHAHGGASNRAGSYYVDEVEDSSKKHRLIPFIYNSSQAYALVFGDNTLRFVTVSGGAHGYVNDGGVVEVATPYGEDDLADLSFTQSADVMYIAHPDYYPYKLIRASHTSWTLVIAPFEDGPYRAVDPDEVDILITPADRDGNNVALSASSAIFNAKHVGSPLRLGYINPLDATDIQWGYGIIDQVTNTTTARMDITKKLGYEQVFNFDFKMGIVGWEDYSTTDSTMGFDPANTSLSFNKGATGISDARQELELIIQEKSVLEITIDNIAGNVRVLIGTTTGGSEITGPTTYNTIGTKTIEFVPTQAEIYITLDNTGSANGNIATISEVSVTRANLSTSDFRLGAWNDTDGYPRAVGIHDQRLCFGGTEAFPLTQWVSKAGGFEDFGFNSPIEDSDAFNYRFDSGKVYDIQWIESVEKMLIGASGAEWKVQTAGDTGSITPTSIDAKNQSNNGCAKIPPIVIGKNILYVQRGASAIRDFAYSLEADGYDGDDLSIMANHLFKDNTITEWAYGKLPYSIVWAVRDDGLMLGLTYQRKHDVWGWHQHETEGEYESVCAVPGDTEDYIYTIVNRTIDGATVRCIEVFMPRINDEDTYDYFFVDCGLTYSGAATTTISGLDHLEGEDVAVLANGSVVEGKTVSSGEIELDTEATLVHVGLPFVSDLGLLGVELSDNYGSTTGRTKSIPSVNIKFEKTRAAWAGPDEDHLDEIPFRIEAYEEDPIALITETKEVTFNSGYDKDGKVFIRNTDPVPMTVLSVTPNVVISER